MTKKILLGIAFVASVASCTDDYKDWVAPQASTPAQAVVFGDGSVSPVNLIDFANIPADQELVKVCNIIAPTVSDQAYTPTFLLTLGNQNYDVDIDGNMKVSDLKAYLENNFGKSPTEREIASTVSMWVSNGITTVKTATSDKFMIKALLAAPFIDEAYWLVGDFAGWDAATALPFTHVGNGNVYDNPTFTITFTTTADNQYWKIIPKTNYDGDFWAGGNTGVVGTVIDGDESFTGNLTTNDPQAGKIASAGMYKMTIDMMNYTYTIEPIAFEDFIYVPGNGQGWNPGGAAALYSENNDGIYTGYAYIDGDFKFTKHRDWSAEYNWNDFASVPAGWTQGDGTNIHCPEAGVFYLTVNVASNTIQAVKVEKMGIIGDFNGWGGDVEMTWNDADNCYEAVGAGVTANGWKFRINSDWGINLGSNDSVEPSSVIDDLVANGKNIGVVGNTIKLYPLRNASDKIYCTVE